MRFPQSGKTPLLFAKNGKLLGLIAVADAIAGKPGGHPAAARHGHPRRDADGR